MRLLLSIVVAVVISLGCLQSSVVAGGTSQSANGPGFRTYRFNKRCATVGSATAG